MIPRLLPALLFIALQFSCGRQQQPDTETGADSLAAFDSVSITEDSVETNYTEIDSDTLLDYTGRYLAGLSQRESNFFASMEDDKYWQEYKLMMDSSWARMTRDRLKKMQDWEATHLRAKINDTLPVFYPFSGPDFLHAQQLFPKTKKIILAALEPIIELPRIDTLSVKERDEFLDTLASSLRDIFQKSYFITTHMKKDFKKVNGVLPLLYVFMERSNYELLETKFIYIDSAGTEQEVEPKKQHWNKTPGVRISFRDHDSKELKTLYYFSVSISNQGLKERPEFISFIKQLGQVNTFVKSASYLMHVPYFTDIKKIIFDQSESIFQDDTGIPYRDFKNNKNWDVTFYGEYAKPVKDFGDEKFQPDLDSAYKATKKKPLPFSLGYHWGTDKQNYMLLRKVNR
jgi:hypothetical protein